MSAKKRWRANSRTDEQKSHNQKHPGGQTAVLRDGLYAAVMLCLQIMNSCSAFFVGDPKWKCLDAHSCTFLEQLSYYLGDLERDRYSHLKKVMHR